MLTLHHSPTTRSFRIKWLLEELGLQYEQKTYNFYNMERHSSDYRRVNAIGSFPTMEDDGLVLTESGAIINHIIRNHGGGRFLPGRGTVEEARVDEWMFWSEGLFAVHQRIFWDHCAPSPGCILNPVPSIGEEAKRQAIKYAGMLENALGEGFLVGEDLTGADFMLSFPLYLANLYDWFANMPRISGYIMRFSARPAFQAAIEDTLAFLQEMRSTEPEFVSFRATENVGG